MRKSSARTQHYRPGSSRTVPSLVTLRQQMADHARGELLLKLREAKHLSREDAAHNIGVSTKTLYTWEHGGKIKWPNAQRVGAFYGVDPESLVSREKPGRDETPNLMGVMRNGDGPDLHAKLDALDAKLDRVLLLLTDDVDEEAVQTAEAFAQQPARKQRAAGGSGRRSRRATGSS